MIWEEIEAHEELMMKQNAERAEATRLAELAETCTHDSPDSSEEQSTALTLPETQLNPLGAEREPAQPAWLLSSSYSLLDEKTIVGLCKSLQPHEPGFEDALEAIFPYATDRLPLYEAALLRDDSPPDIIEDLKACAEPLNPGAPNLAAEMRVSTPLTTLTPATPSTHHRNSRRPRPTIAILGSCGMARSSAVRASSATLRCNHSRSAAPARRVLHEQHPRDHRISGRRQEALAPPT